MASEGKHTVAGVDITRRYMLGCMQSMHTIVVCILYKTDDFNVYKATTFLVNISVLLFGQLRITYSDIPAHFCCVVKSLVHAREHIISITLHAGYIARAYICAFHAPTSVVPESEPIVPQIASCMCDASLIQGYKL